MTSQTKSFIEISDVLGLRFECRKCGVSLTLPIGEATSHRKEHLLKECPNCGIHWALLPESKGDHQPAFNSVLDTLDTLRKMAAAPIGCVFMIEIKPEPAKQFPGDGDTATKNESDGVMGGD
jgi:hypothetical protein